MSETNRSTADSPRLNRWAGAAQWRLVGFGLVVIVGFILVAWVKSNTWSQVDGLQARFAAIKTESFYLGVQLRSGIGRLNGMLLRFQLSQDAAERDAFHQQSRDLSEAIGKAIPFLTTPEEQDLVRQIELAYNAYLAETGEFLGRGQRAVRRDTASLVYKEILAKAEPLLGLCDKLVQAQQIAWDRFLTASQATLFSFERLQQLSLLLLLALVASIIALIYRGLVSPLRVKLSETEAVVERQERLASLGTLATGVAHEIRNPLTAIKFRLFSLKQSLPANLAETEDIQVISGELNRLERIVRDFLQFARPSEPEATKVPAQQLLEEVRDLLKSQLNKNAVELDLEPADGVCLQADKQQIKQVLINLVQNAADSIERGGGITLRARSGVATLAHKSTPVVILEVADTGKGIPEDVERRIFDPFFSTKESGTGLGLPIAARIVEKHGGQLQYQTQRNRGTTFSVVLPRSTDDACHHPAR